MRHSPLHSIPPGPSNHLTYSYASTPPLNQPSLQQYKKKEDAWPGEGDCEQSWRRRPSSSSAQTNSLQCSLGSSCDLQADAILLERAIRANDHVKVKRFLNIHHDKFQVNLHGSVLGTSLSDGAQTQEVEILLTKSKTLIERLENSSSSGSSSSLSSYQHGLIPLVFTNALHLAVEYSSLDVLKLLLKYGIEPNIGGRFPNQEGRPAHPASVSGVSDVEDSPARGKVSWAGSSGKRDKTNTSQDQNRTATLQPDPKSCLRPPRQRSYSFDSSGENSGPRSTCAERRSVSLKSSPREPHIHHGLPPPKPQTERSIFAELRRSSEIFKGILLNLSTREEHQEHKPPSSSSPEPELGEMVMAHETFRMATLREERQSVSSCSTSSVSYSSVSSWSEELDVGCSRDDRIEAESCLKVNSQLNQLAEDIATVYNRQHLFTLPVLFLAVVRGNPKAVYLLLKHGANVNFQDTEGNTVLHLASCRDPVPWDCVLELVERGARVSSPNKKGVRPLDFLPSLPLLQVNMISSAWLRIDPKHSIASNAQLPARQPIQPNFLRKLRARTESGEELSTASLDMREPSSTGSARSSLNRSPELFKEGSEGKRNKDDNKKNKKRRQTRGSLKERQASTVSGAGSGAEKSQITGVGGASLEVERSFQVLLQMSSNPECLGTVLRGLLSNIARMLALLQHRSDSSLHTNMAALLHNLLKTSVEVYRGGESDRTELAGACCLLIKTCLGMIHGVHDLQYTAMVTINKIIDTSVVYSLTHLKLRLSQVLQHPNHNNNTSNSNKIEGATEEASATNASVRVKSRRLGSVWRHAASQQLEQVKKTLAPQQPEQQVSIIEVLSSAHAMSVLNILHNSLTLYKRVIDSKQQCTPSQRWRECSYHCLQLLAARALLFMVETKSAQVQLAQEAQLRILAAALDSTHDPQLLVLVLQIVGRLSLDPANHRALVEQGFPDVLSQLLLPSDEWYYTNHSTKYAKFVKHHVARILVYLGFQHRVNIRLSLYDILQDDGSTGERTPLLESLEDNYIATTSSPPHLVSCSRTKTLLGVSVESAIIHLIKAIEVSMSQGIIGESSTIPWLISGNCYNQTNGIVLTCPELVIKKTPPLVDASSIHFLQSFLYCFPCVISPLIVLRLLLHRLLTTAPHLNRWKSCASRSSFASGPHEIAGPPRSPRSRASSTDTEPGTLRTRRKVNLTVDCSSSADAELAKRLGMTSILQGPTVPRDSIGSAYALGLEPAMQAVLALSHHLRSSHSKESLHSAGSSEGRSPPSDARTMGSFALPFNCQKPRPSFRFSSFRHGGKQRSKSHANITKAGRDIFNGFLLNALAASDLRESPEQEILNFQRQVQNLPDFDSPDPVDGPMQEVMLGGRLRPRSRSMPRVTYEGARFLTLPDPVWPSGSFRLPRNKSAGTLSYHYDHPNIVNVGGSEVNTPIEERRVSSGTIQGGGSRRSSLSPSDRARRRDSPACLDLPSWHRPILFFIEEWLKFSRIDLERNQVLWKELRELMSKVSPLGAAYQQWCNQLAQDYPALNKDPESESADNKEETHREYYQLVEAVLGGQLPCSKEEAASLAGIQLRIEETGGRPGIHVPQPQAQSTPQAPATASPPTLLKPISEDKTKSLPPAHQQRSSVPEIVCTEAEGTDSPANLIPEQEGFLLEVPSFGSGLGRPVSPLVEESGETSEDGDDKPPPKPSSQQLSTPVHPTTASTPGHQACTPGHQIPTQALVVRKAGGFLTKCIPTSSSSHSPFLPSSRLEDCLPQCYHSTKAMAKLIKEQKRKLFHTSYYESELQLKKLYVQTCKRLPAYGSKLFHVKELLRGKTNKKAARLLGLGPQRIVLLDNKTKILAKSQNTADLVQWRTCGGRSHDRVQLEFRGSRWSLVVASVATMRDLGLALWAILQQLHSDFLDEYAAIKPLHQDVVRGSSSELEDLYKLLHFPEELALHLADSEERLFYQVPPIDYLRQVTLDLGAPPPTQSASSATAPSNTTGQQDQSNSSNQSTSVNTLIQRFNEVSSWVTHLIISQPTHEDRKCVLSCILRVALTCWNIGNFNGAMEIIAGLKSTKLKPFWLSITEKEPVPLVEFLSAALLSVEYERALSRALLMPECRVIPFFGAFLRDLRDILSNTPSLVVLAPSGDRTNLEFISDYNGEDHYFTRIGPGGLINLDKIYKTQAVMDKIASFHQHYSARVRNFQDPLRNLRVPPSFEEMESREEKCERDEPEEYEGELDSYRPVQPLHNDHGVSFFPISSPTSRINHHTLQVVHHGTTGVHWEPEGGRSCLVYLRLERSCSVLSWFKPSWSTLKTSSTSLPDYNLSINPEEFIGTKWSGGEISLEEGFLELYQVKDISFGTLREREREPELAAVLKRYSLDSFQPSECCLAILYGSNLSDNRTLYLLGPPQLTKMWHEGLCSVVRGLKRHHQICDRRMFWLKEQYLQLFYEESCRGPMTVDAIRVFGGRDWAITHMAGMSPPNNGTLRRGPSTKFRKKISLGNIQTLKTGEGSGEGRCKGPTSQSVPLPSRSRSISSEMEARPQTSPQSSSDHLDSTSPTHHHRERIKNEFAWQVRHFRHGSITHETQLDFIDFVSLFRSFSLRSRKDLKDLFDQFAMSCRSMSDSSLNDASLKSSPEHTGRTPKIGLLTRNSSAELMDFKNTPSVQKKKIFDVIATSSIVSNCAHGVDTSKSQVITLNNFSKFLETKQLEQLTEDEVKDLIQRHEPDATLRSQHCLSFEGFARFLMDKENFAFINERVEPDDKEMDYPLSHYYIASSHNTYLTGHQLKGESSVDIYSQVLLTGCRCVELDCWDGDDGAPLIYHGHTFTTKIPFRSVVEAINRTAFVTSPYPVILSIENHCSIQQQAKMAHIFQSVFGDKLVTKFLFEADYSDEPSLPSPAQLKNRILIKNKKLVSEISTWTGNMAARRPTRVQPPPPQAGRASSIISNTSGGSVNDDFTDDDDEDDDDDNENIDVGLSTGTDCARTDSLSSHDSTMKTPSRSGKSPASTQADIDWSLIEDEANSQKAKKQSSQIARELSDLVIYIQAIKFRGLNMISPNSSVRCKRVAAVAAATTGVMLKKGSGGSLTGTGSPGGGEAYNFSKQRVNTFHPCYQCSSLNENSARKLCRKQPLPLLAHTETQLVRTYPAAMRIDSSNFNPVMFWAFGIQMVALNYQTEDTPLHLNTAMFEQNGRCGYVPKPSVMKDRTHMMHRRFNPWDKEFDGLHSSQMILNIVSGQYVCQSNLNASVFVEIELIGIQADCNKQKTKVVQRNALNPIWNEAFFFQVMFTDLAFLRFSVLDGNTNHLLCQRVLPLKCLRPGYRHVRLRSPQNCPLQLSTLFIYSRMEEESVGQNETRPNAPESSVRAERPIGGKRRMFFLMVYGVVPDEPYTILKITQESTTQEVILQALQKTGQCSDKAHDYVLVEEVSKGWDRKDREAPASQRVLDTQECPLQAQAQWQGDGKFLLKRMGDDPSSRAWLTSIRSTNRPRQTPTWEESDNFLVCVYNVSPEIPYAILKVPLSACAQDVLAQALVKARRMEDPSKFVLVEELDWGGGRHQRVLPDDENVYRTQAHWQTIGRFILRERDARGRTRTTPLDRLGRKHPVSEALSDPSRLFPSTPYRRTQRESVQTVQVHSEGETLSDDDIRDPDMRNAVSRLKRVSLRKLRVWKS